MNSNITTYEDARFSIIKRALAAALAELEIMPDALLFLSRNVEQNWDIPEIIFGLPVYYHHYLKNNMTIAAGLSPVPWIPLWKENKNHVSRNCLNYFNETYLEKISE